MNLRDLRKQNKKTLQEVASAIGWDASNLSKVERGVQLPDTPNARKIANYYGISIGDVYSSIADLREQAAA